MSTHSRTLVLCTLAVLMTALSAIADNFKDTPGAPGANCGATPTVTISEGSGDGKTSKTDIGCKVKAGSIGLIDPASEGSALSDVITFAANPADATKSIATVFSDMESTLPKFSCTAATPCLTEKNESTGETLTYAVTTSSTSARITYTINTDETAGEVPEPGALLLVGSGLLAMGGFVWKRLRVLE